MDEVVIKASSFENVVDNMIQSPNTMSKAVTMQAENNI